MSDQNATSGPVAVIARIPAVPGKRAELVDALHQAIVNAEGEEGTRYYLLHTADDDPDAVVLYELYDDEAAFVAHGSSDALKALGASLRGLAAGRPELTRLTPVEGKGF